MARLPYVDPADLPDDMRQALAALPPLNLFRMVAHAQTAVEPFLRLGGTLLGQLDLEPRLRELAVIHVARLCESDYEWKQHEPIARLCGVTDEQIAAVASGQVDGGPFDPREAALLAFTREVVQEVQVSTPVFEAMAAHLPPRQLVELTMAIGYYMTVARLAAMAEIEPDEEAAVG